MKRKEKIEPVGISELENSLKQRAWGFPVRKQLGQNFLVNKDILEKIVAPLDLHKDDKVLEIGPGLGFLTEILNTYGASITAVELDPYCIEAVNKLSLANLTLLEADFLALDLNSILEPKSKIVGNIPYNITTPIISKLVGEIGEPAPWLNKIACIVLTVQRELASRLVARVGTKDYSQITLLMNYYGTTEMLFKIGPENFSPPPKVNSAVIKFTPFDKPQVSCKNHLFLRKVIQAGFAGRRKMLKNNLRSLRLSDETLVDIFKELNFDPQVRAESLSLQLFAKLTDAIERKQLDAS